MVISSCCELSSRVLNLEGFDAGIIIEQSQNEHTGPLRSQSGPAHPILALPYLSQRSEGAGSMLAWVCWDEFVNLESPYTVRWIEKCNDAHIAALRITMRSTLSNAVASRDHNIQPASPEIGHLMSALLMAAMSKLGAMRTTLPVVSDKAEDTVTKLMRGLFGNLLTVAGSGVRPLSFVWQLFGLNPQYNVPTSDAEWTWYETVVAVYPYTGWPLAQFHENLQRLLDKAIVRVVSKSENLALVKANRAAALIKYCKLRNIQLDHSRTIITIMMRMLTTEEIDVPAVAARLLPQLPSTLERETQSYTKMLAYLQHLADGGTRRVGDDLIAASVYIKRSAAFGELKAKVSEACERNDWPDMKKYCKALLDKLAEITALWHLKPGSLTFQNMKVYKELLHANFEDDLDQDAKAKKYELTRQVLSDAERKRVPWQVGKDGQFGDNIEPLDESFVHEMLTGERREDIPDIAPEEKSALVATSLAKSMVQHNFSQFASLVQPSFIATMEKDLTPEDVCGIMQVPVRTMRVFIRALNPGFVWEDLGGNFKRVVSGLLQDRSCRLESRPVKKLLELEDTKNLQLC